MATRKVSALVDIRGCSSVQDDVQFALNVLVCQNPHCCKFLTHPIKQCIRGHSICSLCSHGPSCSLCMEAYIQTRSIPVAMLVDRILARCNSDSKSSVDLPLSAKKDCYQDELKVSCFKCIKLGCTWTGKYDCLWDHLAICHRGDTLTDPNILFTVMLGDLNQCNFRKLVLFQGCIFVITFIFRPKDNNLYGAVQIVDDICVDRFKYQFIISEIEEKAKRKICYTRDVYPYAVNLNTVFQQRDCFCFPIDLAFYFKNNDEMNVFSTIIKIDKPTEEFDTE